MNPAFIDVIILLIALEFAGIFLFLRHRGRLDALAAVFFFLLSGAALMVVIRLGLSPDDGDVALPGLLGASFITHVLALVSGWRLIRSR